MNTLLLLRKPRIHVGVTFSENGNHIRKYEEFDSRDSAAKGIRDARQRGGSFIVVLVPSDSSYDKVTKSV